MAKSRETAEPLENTSEDGVDGTGAAEHMRAAMADIRANAEDGVLSVKEERVLLKLDNALRMFMLEV